MCQHATTTNQRSVDVCCFFNLKYFPNPCGILYPMSMPHQIRRRSGKLGTTQLLDLRCGRTSLGRQWIPVTRSWIHHSSHSGWWSWMWTWALVWGDCKSTKSAFRPSSGHDTSMTKYMVKNGKHCSKTLTQSTLSTFYIRLFVTINWSRGSQDIWLLCKGTQSNPRSFNPFAWPRYGAQSAEDARAAMALAAKVEQEESKPIEPWTGEPESLNELVDKYVIENKFSGRIPGTTLYLVQCRARDGSTSQALENQRFKLFIVAWPTKMIFVKG